MNESVVVFPGFALCQSLPDKAQKVFVILCDSGNGKEAILLSRQNEKMMVFWANLPGAASSVF